MNKKTEYLNIQAGQLAVWKTKLNEQCFADLAKHVAFDNKVKVHDPEASRVMRGTDLDNFIMNWVSGTQELTEREKIAEKLISVLKYLAPSVVYEIAREALHGVFDGYLDVDDIGYEEDTPCSDKVFIECWRTEKVNDGPIAFLNAMPETHRFQVERLLREETIG